MGSACQTVKAFRKQGLLFPTRLRNSETTVFRPLNASTAIRVLNNPRYAGCYVYGRRRYRRAIDGKKTVQRKRDHDDWLACIPNAHAGYISWERFQENLKISRPMVRDMRWRAHRLREKVRRCCKDGQYAGYAVSISASATLPGADGSMPGMSVIALTAIAASPTVSRSPGLRSTRPSAC